MAKRNTAKKAVRKTGKRASKGSITKKSASPDTSEKTSTAVAEPPKDKSSVVQPGSAEAAPVKGESEAVTSLREGIKNGQSYSQEQRKAEHEKEVSGKASEKPAEKSVKVDFAQKGGGRIIRKRPELSQDSPFVAAKASKKRLKIMLWGGTGTGKTFFSLAFPNAAVIDLERGTDQYGDDFSFHVMDTTSEDDEKEINDITAEKVLRGVDWLASHEHPFSTLVIDPITVFWESLQHYWSEIFLRRNKKSRGFKFEFYDMQAKDWMPIKAHFMKFMRKVLGLDMNIIVTAREKDKYAKGEMMKLVGETFDGEKRLPYLFDIVLRFFRGEKNEYMARVEKDRTRKIGAEGSILPIDVERFLKFYDYDMISRPAKVDLSRTDTLLVVEEDRSPGIHKATSGSVSTTKTADDTPKEDTKGSEAGEPKSVEQASSGAQDAASEPPTGATAEQIHCINEMIERLGMKPQTVQKRLAAYGANCVEDLTREAATTIFKKLSEALAS